MQSYLSVFSESTHEKVIERSRFIARCAHAAGEDAARAFAAAERAELSRATHNCFAFVADRAGNLLRFSDDGEPQGTAGMPIPEVIRSKKLFETAVVVTRYFGGKKLGAGGFFRALPGQQPAARRRGIREFPPCRDMSRTVATSIRTLSAAMFLGAFTVKDTQYTGKGCVIFAVRLADVPAFSAGAAILGGRVVCGGGKNISFSCRPQKRNDRQNRSSI